MGRLPIAGLCELVLEVQDMDRAVAFWNGTLGIPMQSRVMNRKNRMGFGRHGCTSEETPVSVFGSNGTLRWKNGPSKTFP